MVKFVRRLVVCAMLAGCTVADDSAALQNAIDDCPDGRAILIPAGRDLLRSPIVVSGKGVVLRGGLAAPSGFANL